MASAAQLALREQYNNPAQQREAATLGIWIFLITEVLLFGALITAYLAYRFTLTDAFTKGSGEMIYWIGAVNTAVLICSSLTMALAVHSAEIGKRAQTLGLLLATMFIGVIFLAMKFTEYYLHYKEAKMPGILFHESGPMEGHIQLFFVFYFVMTGLHALHMLIGLGVLGGVVVRILWGSISETYHTPVGVAGLYWHFIDIVWVFLFALLYIPGAHLK